MSPRPRKPNAKATANPEVHVIDAAGRPLGRIASEVATLLQGKRRATYDPRLLAPIEVHIENARKVVVTGRKATQKRYYKHAGQLGHLKVRKFEDVFRKQPGWVIRHAIQNMLPKNRLRAKRLRQLFIRA
ncbi:MAG: 50S ribosomal protein L13 [bacterium]|nr:50S ribosomal protein L13 [bacterium]